MSAVVKVAAATIFAVVLATASANAECVRKGAVAEAGSEEWAKWFALETMVQSVSWGLWPSFVANGSTPGYEVKDQKYRCTTSGGLVKCQGAATFCKTS